MAVVGADDQPVAANVVVYLLQVVVQLHRHPDVVLGERVGAQAVATSFHTAGEIVQQVGDPVGAEFDDAPLRVGEPLRQAGHQQRVERGEAAELVALELRLPAAEDGVQFETPGAGVRAYGHVQLRCPLVDRVEVRVVDEPVADLDAAQVDGDRAVVFRKPQLALRLLQVQHGHRRCPAEAALALRVDVGHPPVVAPAEGNLFGGIGGDGSRPHGGVEHLQVGAELVHVGDARLHVQHELGVGRQHDVADEEAELAARAAARPRRPDGAPADDPVLHHLAVLERLVGRARPVVTLRRVHVVPRLVYLYDVRVCVYDAHRLPPQDQTGNTGSVVSGKATSNAFRKHALVTYCPASAMRSIVCRVPNCAMAASYAPCDTW